MHKQMPLPFHSNAQILAEAALAAGAQGKYWEYEALLFDNMDKTGTPRPEPGQPPPDPAAAQQQLRTQLEQWAQQLGLNMARFRRDLDTNAHRAAIDADKQLAQELGATGTPVFFINGRKLRGAQPIDGFRRVVDQEIERAQTAMRENRLGPAQVYDFVTKNGATRVQLIQAPGAPAPGAAAEPRPGEPDPNRVYALAPPGGNAPSKGPRNAAVTIYEYSDFQ